MLKEIKKHSDSDLIDKLGGTTKAAEFFNVSPPSISEWRKTGLPRARMMYLRLARPELFEVRSIRRAATRRTESRRSETDPRTTERRTQDRRKDMT